MAACGSGDDAGQKVPAAPAWAALEAGLRGAYGGEDVEAFLLKAKSLVQETFKETMPEAPPPADLPTQPGVDMELDTQLEEAGIFKGLDGQGKEALYKAFDSAAKRRRTSPYSCG